jgi:GTP-binding protein
MRIIDGAFLKSVTEIGQRRGLPVPEVCFIGRSNVGKSSLINTLAARKIARTSSTPGATRLINLYNMRIETQGIKKNVIFSDFPGFGYSKVSKGVFHNWQAMIEDYMTRNEWIRHIVWVFDIRRDFDQLDHMLLDWLGTNRFAFSLVLTKADKEGRNRSAARKQQLQRTVALQEIIVFSSKDGCGKKDVLARIEKALDAAIS